MADEAAPSSSGMVSGGTPERWVSPHVRDVSKCGHAWRVDARGCPLLRRQESKARPDEVIRAGFYVALSGCPIPRCLPAASGLGLGTRYVSRTRYGSAL